MCVHTRIKLIEEITHFTLEGINTFVIVLIGQFFVETTETFIELEMNRSFLLYLPLLSLFPPIGLCKLSCQAQVNRIFYRMMIYNEIQR